MEMEMRELYVEGVAVHGGPEPCGHGREAVVEASVGVRVGWAIEPRNWLQLRCRRSHNWRKATPSGGVFASRWRASRGPRTCACAESPCARTGRSDDHSLVLMVGRVVRGRLRP